MKTGSVRHAAWLHVVALAGGLALAAPPAQAAPGDFAGLLSAWKGEDGAPPPQVSVPSLRPVDSFRYTSAFGGRADPFEGNRSFHPGIDLAAPTGTPVHATADALVTRAGRATGYGNLVQLSHGAGIETRYGHLSRILVKPGQRVARGEVIGLVGSTGRSTGSHLHYELRLGNRPVNPLAFMAPGDERLALRQAVGPQAGAATAMGGPRTKK